MKFEAKVFIRLRSQVDDSPGNAVKGACKRLSDLDIDKLRIGKVIDLWFEAPDKEYAIKELYTLSDRLLANTVIEDWSFELNEAD
jgi:phosphoribosylformylglycinamidine synthase